MADVTKINGQQVMGARGISLGQAVTALPNSEWALFDNPAMIEARHRSVSFFGIRNYGLTEVTDMAATGAYPTSWGVIGVGAHRYGYELFNENRIRIGYKHAFGNFHYGAVINYNHIVQGRGYGSAGAFGIDAGIAAVLFEKVWIAARTTNINQPAYDNIDEPLPREMAIGFSYKFSDKALFTMDIVKDVRFPISYRSGVEIVIFNQFEGRIGLTTNPTTFSAGFGYSSSWWKINVVAQNHIDLGISPGLDLSIIL